MSSRLLGEKSQTSRTMIRRPCMTVYDMCMTMLSFRVDPSEAREMQQWADRLGIDRSQLLRDAVRRHLDQIKSEGDADAWDQQPLTDEEQSLASVATWGPAEDWADWADAAR